MALSKLLLLLALFFSLLLLMVPSHCKEDPTSTQPAISQATSTICGITTSLLHRSKLAHLSAFVPSPPKLPPGICVPDLCGGSGVICKMSDTGKAVSCQFSPDEIIETLQRWLKYFVLFLVFCLFGIGCGFCLRVCCERVVHNSVHHDVENLLVPTFPVMENVQVFSFNDLKTITNNFCKRIGSGEFGKVFWGQLSDNHQVAVKRGNTPLGPALEKAFRTEVETLSKAHHENIIDLIGYCTENNERILVYQFISRKDLYGHLHPRFWQKKSMLFSSWKLRVKVLLDVAKGIEYLHKNADPRVIQRDIKSANILIDENWVAKISDFGISVFGPEAGGNYVELDVASGTAGYLDPDCNAESNIRASPSNDVYSFGVVMLEVVTGWKAIKELAFFVPQRIRLGKLMDVMDKRLPVPVGRELEAVTKVAQLARQCVLVHRQRPDIGTILTELEGALALFDPPEDQAASTS